MVGLSEIYQLEYEPSMCHDVAGLEIQMRDLVLLQISQCLADHKDEVDLGVEGQRFSVFADVVAEVGTANVVHQQVIFVRIVLFGEQVVLGQEHRYAVFDLGEDEPLVRHPTLPRLLHQFLVFSLDDDVLLQRRSVLGL